MFHNIKKTATLAWMAMWFFAIAASPVVWMYLATYGPSFFADCWTVEPIREATIVVNNQQVRIGDVTGYSCWHTPAIVSCVLFDLVFVFLAFTPAIFKEMK